MGLGVKFNRKTEGGSGGKRGHSNMVHWKYTEEIKAETKRARRILGKKLVAEEVEKAVRREE